VKKTLNILNYPYEKLIKEVMAVCEVSRNIAIDKINNGIIKPSSTGSYFHFYVSGYRFPILSICSENLMNYSEGFIKTFYDDYEKLEEYHLIKNENYHYSRKKIQIMTNKSMNHIWGKAKMLREAINEIKIYIINAKVVHPDSTIIADKSAANYYKILEKFDLRFGRGIYGDWGILRLIIKWGKRINFNEYIKIRNSFDLEDWENMLTFEHSFNKKYKDRNTINFLEKDKMFAHIFQFGILKDAMLMDNSIISEKFIDEIINSTVWVAKNIFEFKKGKWFGIAILHYIGELYSIIYNWPPIISTEQFRKEYNASKTSFNRQRKIVKDFFSFKAPFNKNDNICINQPVFLNFIDK